MGVFDEMLAAGGERISETVFFARNGKSVAVPSAWFGENAQRALSLSRAEMDFRLLEKAKQLNVEVLEETSASKLIFDNENLSGIKIRNKNGDANEVFAGLIIDATGRASVLGKLAEKENSRRRASKAQLQSGGKQLQNPKFKIQNRLVGFKAHLKDAHPENGRCEIYFFRGGYGGLSRVENDLANFCFLVKADLVKEFSGDAEKIIEKAVFQNKRAAETLKNAVPVHEWLAVSVDGFGAKNLNLVPNLLAVGDAGAFIDPFTGSGMLMALESAELLARCVSENAFSNEKIAENYKLQHRKKFQNRLRLCALIRRLAFAPALANIGISVLSLSDKPREFLARATRRSGFENSKRCDF